MITCIPSIISSNVQVFQTMVEEVHSGRGTAIQSSRQWEEKTHTSNCSVSSACCKFSGFAVSGFLVLTSSVSLVNSSLSELFCCHSFCCCCCCWASSSVCVMATSSLALRSLCQDTGSHNILTTHSASLLCAVSFHCLLIMVSEVFIKCKILSVEATLSAYTHPQTHTQAPAHLNILSTHSLIYTQLKMGSKQRLWDGWRQHCLFWALTQSTKHQGFSALSKLKKLT